MSQLADNPNVPSLPKTPRRRARPTTPLSPSSRLYQEPEGLITPISSRTRARKMMMLVSESAYLAGGTLLTPPKTPLKRKRKQSNAAAAVLDVPGTPKRRKTTRVQSSSKVEIAVLDVPGTPKRRKTTRVQSSSKVEIVEEVTLATPPPSTKKTRTKTRKTTTETVVKIVFPLTPQDLHTRLLAVKPTLIQERVAHDPWRIIISVILLNKTSHRVAVPVFWQILARWPTANELAKASLTKLTELLQPLGLQNIRAARLIKFSEQYVESPACISRLYPLRSDRAYPPTEIAHYAGVGRYAVDSWRIYSPLLKGGGAPRGAQMILDRMKEGSVYGPGEEDEMGDAEWKEVMPLDKELKKYLIWRWAVEGYIWTPDRGVCGPVNDVYLESLLAVEAE